MPGRCIPLLLSIVIWLMMPLVAAAQDGVEIGKQALKSTRQPWYDAESDGLKPLIVNAEDGAERADWRGAERPDWNWNWNWNGPNMSWVGELLKWFAWIVLIGLLALLVYALVRTFLNMETPFMGVGAANRGAMDQRTEQQRIENLPIQLSKKKGDFLQIAREQYQAGNFSEAIIYLFSHRLLQLDKAGYIRLTKGKTNRQYLMEISRPTELQKILGQTIVSFEDVFFGQHSLSRERFEGCWNTNDEFQSFITQAMS